MPLCQFENGTIQCVPGIRLCDGIADCIGGLDESIDLCGPEGTSLLKSKIRTCYINLPKNKINNLSLHVDCDLSLRHLCTYIVLAYLADLSNTFSY